MLLREGWIRFQTVPGGPSVDTSNIGIFGTSYGGGLVTYVAANDSRAKCVIAQVPGISHYGVYNEKLEEATQIAAAWFRQQLMGK